MLMAGQLCAGTTLLTFDNVRVPAENIIGQEHKGFKQLLWNFNHGECRITPPCDSRVRIAKMSRTVKYRTA